MNPNKKANLKDPGNLVYKCLLYLIGIILLIAVVQVIIPIFFIFIANWWDILVMTILPTLIIYFYNKNKSILNSLAGCFIGLTVTLFVWSVNQMVGGLIIELMSKINGGWIINWLTHLGIGIFLFVLIYVLINMLDKVFKFSCLLIKKKKKKLIIN